MIKIDKKLHFLGSYAICTTLFVLFGFVWQSVVVAVLAGCYKEFMDSKQINNYWSWGDIAADLLGILFFISMTWLGRLL